LNTFSRVAVFAQQMIAVLVMSANRAPFQARFDANQATWEWFEKQGISVIKVVGDPSIAAPSLVGTVLTVPVMEAWEHLGLKVWWAVSHVFQDANIEGVFKVDDDVKINSESQALDDIRILSKHAYASLAVGIATQGMPIRYAQTRVADTSPWRTASVSVPSTTPYASGSFMYLSRSSLELLSSVHALIAFAQSPIEDLTTAQILSKARVPLTVLTSTSFSWGHLDRTVGCSEDEFAPLKF